MKEFKVVRKQIIISYAFIEAETFEDAEAIAEYETEDFELSDQWDEYSTEAE